VNLLANWSPDVMAGSFDALTLYVPRPVDRTEVVLPDGIRERVLRPTLTMLGWENLRLGLVATDDVLFCPSYSRPLLSRGRTVVAIHDATPRMHPELYGRAQTFLYNPLYCWSARSC
jgi:hypothetical protein